MTRGQKKGAFAIDAQRGEGSAERERMLRTVPVEETPPTPTTPAVVEPTMPRANGNVANVFRSTDKPGIQAVDELPEIEGLDDTFIKEGLNFAGKNHSIGKLASGIWKQYYSTVGLADIAIKNALEANRPELEGNTQRLKKSIDKITLRVTDAEKSSERYGKIYDEMTNKIEETYAIELDE